MTLISSNIAVTNEIDVECLSSESGWFRCESEGERSVHMERYFLNSK